MIGAQAWFVRYSPVYESPNPFAFRYSQAGLLDIIDVMPTPIEIMSHVQ